MWNWTWGLSLIALTMAIHATGIAFMALTTLRIGTERRQVCTAAASGLNLTLGTLGLRRR